MSVAEEKRVSIEEKTANLEDLKAGLLRTNPDLGKLAIAHVQ